jgi:hypothetical protein
VSQDTSNHSFDELTRGLASGSISRGRALRLMGAAVVGGALASLGIGEAAADPPGCKRNGKKCKKDEQCCSRRCVNGTCANRPTAEPCSSGTVLLSNGTCAIPCGSPAACPNCGNTLGAVCFGTEDNRFFCGGAVVGACGPNGSCPTGQFCSFGDCVVACQISP